MCVCLLCNDPPRVPSGQSYHTFHSEIKDGTRSQRDGSSRSESRRPLSCFLTPFDSKIRPGPGWSSGSDPANPADTLSGISAIQSSVQAALSSLRLYSGLFAEFLWQLIRRKIPKEKFSAFISFSSYVSL